MSAQEKGAIIVIRHGERLDYVCRDSSSNWIPTSPEPWNPPLTRAGLQQAQALGRMLHEHIKTHDLPSEISHVYSSPLLRCVQTAAETMKSYEQEATEDPSRCSEAQTNKLKVKIEHGLVESMSEDWYSSWCLPDSDSTWGFFRINRRQKNLTQNEAAQHCDMDTLHPKAKVPVQNVFPPVHHIARIHKQHEELFRKLEGQCTSTCLDQVADAYNGNDSKLLTPAQSAVDLSYTKPYHVITNNYRWGTFESHHDQCNRVETVVRQMAKDHPNETILVFSHGCPVTTLFQRLTGKGWQEHGMTKYTCCSIYVLENGGERFTDVLVNDASHLENQHAGEINYM